VACNSSPSWRHPDIASILLSDSVVALLAARVS